MRRRIITPDPPPPDNRLKILRLDTEIIRANDAVKRWQRRLKTALTKIDKLQRKINSLHKRRAKL